MRANGGVDAAARIHSSIAGPVMMRNTPPPLASNDLFDAGSTKEFIGLPFDKLDVSVDLFCKIRHKDFHLEIALFDECPVFV